ncbi:MAG: hypothetical protein IPL65_05760 [Lewinellaceae bacterium]|nr:hypothetical protein [Lewinellaceae bacterium]
MKHYPFCLSLVTLLFVTACNNDKPAPVTQTNEPKNLQEAMDMAQKAIEKNQHGEMVEPIHFSKLKEFLPEKAAGFERVGLSGETTGAINMKISKAEASYKNQKDQKLNVDIVDTGGIGMAMMGIAAWSSISIDREDEEGYERTGTLNGFKSFEKSQKKNVRNELSLIVGDRYIVAISCEGCEMRDLYSVVKGMDLTTLKNLR